MRKAAYMKQLDNLKLILNHVVEVKWLRVGYPPLLAASEERFVSIFAFEFKIIQALGNK